MSQSAYFVSRDRAVRVAKDNGPIPLSVHHLPPMMQAGIRRNGLSEMVLFVEEGIVEFMIGGAAGVVSQGGFVRIPAEVSYAFRNAGDETARIISQTGPNAADSAA